MPTLQHLPYLGTAEEDVLFVEWLVEPGASVKNGQPIATVETLKAAFEVEAEHEGVLLRCLCEPGDRVEVKAPIAVIGAADDVVDDEAVARLQGAVKGEGAGADSVQPTITAPAVAPAAFASGGAPAPVAPAARRLAKQLGVDLATVQGSGPDGLVRAADIEQAHAAPKSDAGTAEDAGLGRIDPVLLEFIRRDERAFAALPAARKLWLYRRHGAQIGEGCHLAPGVVIKVDRLVLGDGAYFGPDTTIEAAEFVAGSLLHFGARCRVRCTRLRFGDNAFLTDDIEIGGGGANEPEAELVLGSHGFVGEHVHLNPCRRLSIGDEVVISREVVVMTHSFGPSWLRGYPSRFHGVAVDDGAQLGIGAVLFPGVTVGAGAVVLSGSSVVTAVPPGRLYGGVPATDLKAAAQQLTPDEVGERADALVQEFGRQLGLRGFDVEVRSVAGGLSLVVRRDGGEHRLSFGARWPTEEPAAGEPVERVRAGVHVADDEFAAAAEEQTHIGLDPPRIKGPIGPLAAAFREFLRKRGVRLRPRTWAYTGGWL